ASCEVELVLDNEDGDGPLDFSELSIMRRLHRGGEGQYLINRASVRRLDLVELLADLGLGTDGRSIVGQGRVEEILASRPEERRALIEEAAGLGSLKRRRHRAELKLARVATQVERARDLEAEVRARLRPLKLQATAAERAERLAGEAAALAARLVALEAAERSQRAEAEPGGPSGAELEGAAAAAAAEHDALATAERLARTRLAALETALVEREGLAPAARALAEAGERLAVSALEVEPGYERAVAAALA